MVLVLERAKNQFSLRGSVLAHLTQRRCYLLIFNFNVMLKQKEITQSPVQTKNEQTIERLNEYFKLLTTPEDTAKLLRQAVFTLSEFHTMPEAPLTTYGDNVNAMCFYLNQLAERLEPYFTKD